MCPFRISLQSRCIGYSRRRDIHLLIQNAQQLLATPKILQKYSLHVCIQKTSTKMTDVVHSGNMIHHQINSNCYISLGYQKKNGISPLKQTTSPCKVCMSLGAFSRLNSLAFFPPPPAVAELDLAGWKCRQNPWRKITCLTWIRDPYQLLINE